MNPSKLKRLFEAAEKTAYRSQRPYQPILGQSHDPFSKPDSITNYYLPQTPGSQAAGGAALHSADKVYRYTPKFRSLLAATRPEVVQASLGLESGGGLTGGGAAGLYLGASNPFNKILIADYRGAQQVGTLTHEGLHDVYARGTGRDVFKAAYNQGISPGLREYLQGQLAGYSAGQKLNDFSRLESLPPEVQNEIHSYIPEYYTNVAPVYQTGMPKLQAMLRKRGTYPEPISPALRDYYNQFFDIAGAAERERTKRSLQRTFPTIFSQPQVR